jgi:hypothetical protein
MVGLILPPKTGMIRRRHEPKPNDTQTETQGTGGQTDRAAVSGILRGQTDRLRALQNARKGADQGFRTLTPLILVRIHVPQPQTSLKPLRDEQAPEAHEGGAFGCRLVAGKAEKAAEARPVGQRLGQCHVRKIVPSCKQERLEHRQRRSSLLAFWPRKKLIRNRPINQRGKLIEARLTLGLCAELKDFLPNPPMRHDPLHIRMGQTESRSTSRCKHPQKPAHRSRSTWNILVRLTARAKIHPQDAAAYQVPI